MKKMALLVGLLFFAVDATAFNPTVAAESEPVQEQAIKPAAEPGAAAKREIARKKKRKNRKQRKHRRNRRHRR